MFGLFWFSDFSGFQDFRASRAFVRQNLVECNFLKFGSKRLKTEFSSPEGADSIKLTALMSHEPLHVGYASSCLVIEVKQLGANEELDGKPLWISRFRYCYC